VLTQSRHFFTSTPRERALSRDFLRISLKAIGSAFSIRKGFLSRDIRRTDIEIYRQKSGRAAREIFSSRLKEGRIGW
jgi:hypothetical protein